MEVRVSVISKLQVERPWSHSLVQYLLFLPSTAPSPYMPCLPFLSSVSHHPFFIFPSPLVCILSLFLSLECTSSLLYLLTILCFLSPLPSFSFTLSFYLQSSHVLYFISPSFPGSHFFIFPSRLNLNSISSSILVLHKI